MRHITIPLLFLFLGLEVTLSHGYSEKVAVNDDGSGGYGEPDNAYISQEGSGMPPKNLSTIAEGVAHGSGLPEESAIRPGPMLPPKTNIDGSGSEVVEGSGREPIPAVPHGSDEEIDGSGSGDPENPKTAKPLHPGIEDFVTGVPEESTMAPRDPAEYMTHASEIVEEDVTGPTTPFDIDNLETGVPEGSTKEPYMPKPVTKPKPGQHNNSGSGHYTDSGYSGGTDFTDVPEESSELPMESIPPVHWTKSTPKDFTISQKIDETSLGYKQLLHMLEDLGHRRKEDIVETKQTEFYIDRASTLMDAIDNSFTNVAISNITMAQEYIKGLLADASPLVRQSYSEIVSLTSQPSFYYIPKRQRYLMVNKIVTDMNSTGQQEMMSLNKKVKTYCRNANVDIPPYSLGNLMGNMLANGAVLTK